MSIGILIFTVCLNQGLRAFWKGLNEGRNKEWGCLSSVALMPFFFSKEHFSWVSAASSLPAMDRFLPEKFSSALIFIFRITDSSLDCYTHRSHTHEFFPHPFKLWSVRTATAITGLL